MYGYWIYFSVWLDYGHGRGFNSQVVIATYMIMMIVHLSAVEFRSLWPLFPFINIHRVLIMGALYILGAVLYGCRWLASDLKQIKLWNRDLLGLTVPPSHSEVRFSSNLVQDSWEVPAWKIRHLVPVSSGKHMMNSTEIKLLSINRTQT